MTPEGGFEIGDHAVYPVQGVVRVIGIEEKDVGGARQRFYVLAILGLDRKVLVPTTNASAVGLRALMSPEEIDEVKRHLADKPTTFDLQTWNRRARMFAERIKTGDAMEIADIVRELAWLREKKVLSFGERRTLDTTKALLVKEIAVAQGEPEDTVRDALDALFGAALPAP